MSSDEIGQCRLSAVVCSVVFMKGLYVLFEHASGYALFIVKANEEIGALLPQVQESVKELDRFGKVVKLVAFVPFTNAQQSLENVIAVSEGNVHNDLREFVLANIGAKPKKIRLGVAEPKLASSLQESLGVKCDCGETITEICRGIRTHFTRMVEGVSSKVAVSAQLGLGHSYSRNRVKFNVNKADNMVIQSIALIDQLDKDINTFSMRIREWYSYHFPEMYKMVNDNAKFNKLVHLIGDRSQFNPDEHLNELMEIMGSEEACAELISQSKISMGTDINEIDLMNIRRFAKRVLALLDYRKSLSEYLTHKMTNIAPNLTAVIGESVGAKLISQAGSLINLAKCPASTLQILGAEKALFRAIKTRGRTPKYGLIFHSSYITRAPTNFKGRVSRLLAHKCSIASRMDCFQEEPNSVIGECLSEQIEERLKFMQNSHKSNAQPPPRSNTEVMKAAIEKFSLGGETKENTEVSKKKKKRRSKKSLGPETVEGSAVFNDSLKNSHNVSVEESPKKKTKLVA